MCITAGDRREPADLLIAEHTSSKRANILIRHLFCNCYFHLSVSLRQISPSSRTCRLQLLPDTNIFICHPVFSLCQSLASWNTAVLKPEYWSILGRILQWLSPNTGVVEPEYWSLQGRIFVYFGPKTILMRARCIALWVRFRRR